MKFLPASEKPVPRPFPDPFLRGALRRMVPLAAMALACAALAIAPASALQMAARVGFKLPSSTPTQTSGKSEGDQSLGMFRPGACAPLALTFGGAETGDAQAVVSAKVGTRTITYTRALRLNGTPQTVCLTLSGAMTAPDEYANPGTLDIQILQDGRSLAHQEIRLVGNMARTNQSVLDLTGGGSLSRSLRDYNNLDAKDTSYSSTYNPTYNGPRELTATPESLPDSAQGYEAIDAVVLNYAYPLEMASAEQQEALHEYVREGGRLILIGAAQPGQISTLRNTLAALPFKPAAEKFAATYGIQAALDGMGLVLSAPDTALAKEIKFYGLYRGGGARRPDLEQDYEREIGKQWQYLLNGKGTPLFSPRQALIHASAQNNYSGNELTDALAGRQAAQTVPFPLLTGFLLAYIVLIIPVNYLVLKKLDRRELAWITAPVLVFLFSGVSYAVAHAIKGGNLTVNRAVIYEGFANTPIVTGRAQFTLYSPHRAAYDISIGDANDPENPYRSIQPMEAQRSQRGGVSDLTVARNASTSLRNVSVPQWDTRSFDVPVTGLPGGALEARVTLQDSLLHYRLTNHTKYALHHCSVIVGEQYFEMSDMGAGETAEASVVWNGSLRAGNVFAHQPYTSIALANRSAFSLRQSNATAGETQELIREALKSTLRDYSGAYGSAYNYSNNTSFAQNQNALACGFIGWFDAKTLDVRVDGQAPEGEQENMLYVHLPLPRNTSADSTDAALLRLIPDAGAASTNAKTAPLENRDAE